MTTDLNGAINKIGIFNKSFADLKNAISANGIRGLFNSISPAITSKDLSNINEYNRLVGVEGVSSQTAWYRTMLSSSKAAQSLFDDEKNLIRTNNGLILSEEAVTQATKTMTLSAKAAELGMKALSIAGNMILFMAISKGIQLAVSWIDKLVHSAEYAEKAIKAATDSAKSFSDTIKDIQKETVDMGKSVDSIINKYAKLSQGVNTFTNENQSLPTDQYEEFLELNKQLTELFPSLTRNYDENGNAILGLSGSVDSVTESIRSLVEQEKELARAQIRENLEQYFDGTDDADGAWKALEGRKQKLEEANEALITLKNTYEGLKNADDSTVIGQYHKNFVGKEQAKYIEYIKDNFGEDIAEAMEDAISIHLGKGLNGQFADLVVDFSSLELTETQKEQITRSYDTFYSELLAKQKTAMSEFDSQNSEFSNNALLWLEDLSFYKDSDKYVQTAIQNLVRNIDWSNYDFEELDYDGVKRILQDSILTPFQVACDNPNTKKSLDNALKSLFTMDTTDMTVGDITEQVSSYINTIATAIGENPEELKIRLGFDDSDTQPLINNVKSKLQDEFDDKVGELKLDELQIAAEQIEVSEGTLLSWDELIAKIEEIKKSLPDAEPKKLFNQLTTSQESLDKFQSSVKSASDAYATLLSGNYSSSELLDSIQTINQAVSDMGGSLDWEKIDIDFDSLNLLQKKIEQVSKEYAKSVLSGAGIDINSRFGQMLANNIIQAQKASMQLEVLDKQIDSLQSAYSDLSDIVETYNETGSVTFDQLQILLEMEPQYLACLMDENGQLQLNEETVTALANQRLNDAEAQAVQQAISELGQITLQDEKQAVEENAQAFSNAVNDLADYNAELANTIAEASLGAASIRDLNAAISGAEANSATDDQINTILDNLNTKLEMIGNVRDKIKTNGVDSVLNPKSAGSAGKSAGDAYVDAFEEELKELQDLRDRGVIDETEYLHRLRELYTRYFADRKEYLDEFRKYERQYLEGRHTCPPLQ